MTIQEKVAEKIAGSNDTISAAVIDKMANTEINKRVDILFKSIEKQDAAKAALSKINYDDITEYVDGEPKTKMSEARYKEIKKAKESLEKLTKAIEIALAANTADSYNKLAEASK